ncbi:MAG: hypothetical protein LKF36_03320 [Lactobacillus sp.]|jgi:hypothetical protein|nr:hypothetical protein [Lactobacillus sp.]
MIVNKETASDEFANIIPSQNLKRYLLEDIQTHLRECFTKIQDLHKQSNQVMVHIRGGLSFKDSNKILKSLLATDIPFKIYDRKSLTTETASTNTTVLIVSRPI